MIVLAFIATLFLGVILGVALERELWVWHQRRREKNGL